MQQRDFTKEELTDILDKLQGRIQKSQYIDEVVTLKGSYGVYLHYLRVIDMSTAQSYIDWMRQYNGDGNYE